MLSYYAPHFYRGASHIYVILLELGHISKYVVVYKNYSVQYFNE